MEPVVLKRSLRKTLMKLTLPVLFGLLSVWLLARPDLSTLIAQKIGFIGPAICWLGVVLFTFSMILFVLTLIPSQTHMIFNEHGLKITNLFYARFYQWTDFETIAIYSRPEVNPGYKAIAFNLVPEKRRGRNNIARRCCGFDGLIPDLYTVSTEQIFEMLNTWRSRGRAVTTA